jgi:hypothetical protein
MIYWYNLIYSPACCLDDNGLNDGEDMMIAVIIIDTILGM